MVADRHADFELSGNASSDVLLISYGIVSRVVSPLRSEFALFRPLRIFPPLVEELRQCANNYEEVVVIEANDGQYANVVELALNRRVHRVPILGGRINLRLVVEGLEGHLGRAIHYS